jgi:hypothetical protein
VIGHEWFWGLAGRSAGDQFAGRAAGGHRTVRA